MHLLGRTVSSVQLNDEKSCAEPGLVHKECRSGNEGQVAGWIGFTANLFRSMTAYKEQ
jgi:hypothetical protein